MQGFRRGLLAACVASAAGAAMVIVLTLSAATPGLDPIALLSRGLGRPGALGTGWLAYFAMTIPVGGVLFHGLAKRLRRPHPGALGTLLGAVLWLALRLALLAAPPSPFAASTALLETALLTPFLVYGFTLGVAHLRLETTPGDRRAAAPMSDGPSSSLMSGT